MALCSNQIEPLQRQRWLMRSGRALGLFALLCCFALTPISAQTFNSGSTGADDMLSDTVFPASCSKVSQTITCPLPENGVYHFTTVNIPSGYTLKFLRNSRNTPVTLLASGNVTIAGTIDIQGQSGNSSVIGFNVRPAGGLGGPGGFDGGGGGSGYDPFSTGTGGNGPGGGGGGNVNGIDAGGGGGGGGFLVAGTNGTAPNQSLAGPGGLRYGTKTLLPLIGGSGGGGGGSNGGSFHRGGGGGGGGGGIVIASSATITFGNGEIRAKGGDGNINCASGTGGGGGGAGGGIRLIATTIAGSGNFQVDGGIGPGPANCGSSNMGGGGNGSKGYVRIEAYNYNNFNPSPSPDFSVISSGLPSPVTITSNTPQLTITSVAGSATPATPKGSLHNTPDIQLPANQANPVAVALSAANIPPGTIVTVAVTPETGGQVAVQSTPLAGTTAASTATASVNLVQGMNLINATVIIDLSSGNKKTALFIEGERIKRVEVNASYGGKSEVTYITESGKRIKPMDE